MRLTAINIVDLVEGEVGKELSEQTARNINYLIKNDEQYAAATVAIYRGLSIAAALLLLGAVWLLR